MKLNAILPTAVILVSSVVTVTGCSQSSEEGVVAAEGAQTQTSGVPKVGEYEASTEARFGGLKIKQASATSLDFELEVYNNFGGFNMGQTEGSARGSAGLYKFKGDDCQLSFKVAGAAIEIAQEGGCDFGANVIADGTYTPKAPEPAVVSHCASDESVVFSCKSGTKKVISICSKGGAVQYRFGAQGKVELKLPAQMADIATKPEVAEGGFIPLAGPGGGGAWATFHNGEYDYNVFTMESSRGMDSEGRSLGTENTSGVLVNKAGAQIAYIACAGEPKSELPSDLIAASSEQFDPSAVP